MFNDEIDEPTDDGTVITHVACPVGQKWTVKTVDGQVSYSMIDTEVVKITDQFPFSVHFPEGVEHNAISNCDGHFLAFSTDHDMDKLLAVKVEFKEQNYKKEGGNETSDDPVKREVVVVDGQIASSSPTIFGVPKIGWERIQAGKDFAENCPYLSSEERELYSTYQWVLGFYETKYYAAEGSVGWAIASGLFAGGLFGILFAIPAIKNMNNCSGTLVTEVGVLELIFEKDGKVYDVGVVGNKQTGEFIPKDIVDIPWWVWLIVAAVILLLVCVVLGVLSAFFPIVGVVLKGVWSVVTAPFRLIAKLVEKARGE